MNTDNNILQFKQKPRQNKLSRAIQDIRWQYQEEACFIATNPPLNQQSENSLIVDLHHIDNNKQHPATFNIDAIDAYIIHLSKSQINMYIKKISDVYLKDIDLDQYPDKKWMFIDIKNSLVMRKNNIK